MVVKVVVVVVALLLLLVMTPYAAKSSLPVFLRKFSIEIPAINAHLPRRRHVCVCFLWFVFSFCRGGGGLRCCAAVLAKVSCPHSIMRAPLAKFPRAQRAFEKKMADALSVRRI